MSLNNYLSIHLLLLMNYLLLPVMITYLQLFPCHFDFTIYLSMMSTPVINYLSSSKCWTVIAAFDKVVTYFFAFPYFYIFKNVLTDVISIGCKCHATTFSSTMTFEKLLLSNALYLTWYFLHGFLPWEWPGSFWNRHKYLKTDAD